MGGIDIGPSSAGGSASAILYPTHFAQVMHLLGYGQSTSIGVGGGNGPFTTGLYGALMFNTGLRVAGVDGGGAPTSLVPLVESVGSSGYGETGIGSAANAFVAKLAAAGVVPPLPTNGNGFVVLGSTGGRGGMSISQLSKGGPYYTEMMGMVSNGYALSLAAGKTYALLGMPYTQGERDIELLTTADAYKAALSTLKSDVAADAQTITGQDWKPPFLLAQVASQMKYYTDAPSAGFRPTVALAQRAFAREQADTVCALPRYILPYTDNVHHNALGYEIMGRYYGRALEKVAAARLNLSTVEPVVVTDLKSAVWQGSYIDLEFEVPFGGLVFDTTRVADTPNKGFDIWSPDGTVLQDIITGVTIVGPKRVIIAMSTTPASGSRLSYGFGRPGVTTTSGPATGARGNLRDQEGDIDSYTDSSNATRRLDNWCLIFEAVKP